LWSNGEVDDLIIKTRVPNFHLLTVGTLPFSAVPAYERLLSDGKPLKTILESVEGRYDLVIIDTQGGLGSITRGALWVATHVLTPVQAEPMALRTFPQLLDALGKLRFEGSKVALVGVLLTMFREEDEASRKIAKELWKRLPKEVLLNQIIPRDPLFLKASAAGVPVALLCRRPPPVLSVFEAAARVIEERMGLKMEDEYHEPLALVD